jgi:hypothetical protein
VGAGDKVSAMLFHITQVHDPAECPYGQGGSRKFHDASVEGVTVHGVYGAFMEHTIFMVVEADDFDLLNKFLLPGMKQCSTDITPVSAQALPVWS